MQAGRASLRILTRVTVLILVLALFGISGPPASAIHDIGLFELDRNTADPSGDAALPDDWDTIYNLGFVGGDPTPGSSLGFIFAADKEASLESPKSFFTGGGSKDDLDISLGGITGSNVWAHDTTPSPPDKDDITNAYAALYRYNGSSVSGGVQNGDLILYFGLDRYARNGDAQVGFWLLQDTVTMNPDPATTFSGKHKKGDLLLQANFTNGGVISRIQVFEWVDDGSGEVTANGTLQLVLDAQECNPAGGLINDKACGTVNQADTTPAWPYTPKSGPGITPGVFPPGSFFEAGLNVTQLLPSADCFSTIIGETRSSASVDSQLKDFALGNFNLCQISVSKTGSLKSKIGDPANYTVTITNSGVITLYKDDVTDTLLGNLVVNGLTQSPVSPVTSITDNCGASLAPGASCTIQVSRTVQAGDPDPLPNTVTVTYNGKSNLTGTSKSASASHSVNLFQPAVDVTKSGPALAKAGDAITYSFSITNTGSSDSPNLVLDSVSDNVVGSLTSTAAANGCSSLAPGASCNFTAQYTVQGADPDPLPNTVTVHYHPSGFPNDITDNASHEVNLFQPNFTVTKTGDELSKIGDEVTYTYTITNTSSADSPNLNLVSISDNKLGNLASHATAAGCDVLSSPSETCSFQVDHTVPGGASDPYVNQVTVTYQVVGFPNQISHSDTHSVNLFQPVVDVVKSGTELSKVGDTVTYNFTVTNTSSLDSPNLALDTISDTLLGDLASDAASAFCGDLAPGASCNFSRQYIVQAGDPDPLLNTVTVHYHPTGFSNDIADADAHSVNLFQPSFAITKGGDTLSKIGDQVTYTFQIQNTSSSDSPNLNLVSISDDKLGDLAAAATAAGCDMLASNPGETCNFQVNHTIPGGASDPYDNQVTATYQVDGFPNQLVQSDGHSVNLFQPSLTFDKTGDSISKAGDTANWTITLTNTSSADSPDLVCTITDPLLGVNKQVTLASGDPADVTNVARVTQATDPDPLVNTASVQCSPQGFPNVLEASDGHEVNLFQPSVSVEKTGDELSKVGDEVTYHFVITNTSSSDSPNLVLDSVTDTLLGTLAAQAGATDQVPADCDNLAPGASCSFDVNRTVQAGDSDPLPNTVTIHYHPTGFPNDITDSDDHSVNLFQPSITFDKTGDTLSKVGDDVNYTITLNNTSSADSPNLTCRITDPLLGLDKQVNLASGASDVTNTSRTVQAGDPDPLPNTASVLCTVDGFGNELRSSDGHSVNLFQPSVTVDKTSANPYSKAGDAVRYVFTITNTSSGDSPNLVFDSMTDTLLGPLTPPSSCNNLVPGGSCAFTVDRTVLATDADPLPNTVTVHYHPTGFPNDISDNDDHSVDLLHPDYTVTKDCLTEVVPPGGTAIFRVTYTNTGDVALNLTDDEAQIPDFTLTIGETRTFEIAKQAGSGPIVENTVNAVATLPNWTGLPNRLERAATDHCDVRGGATRTLGFWQTHIDYATHVFNEHSPNDQMDFGWKVASDVGDVMGIFWANVARQTTGQRRNQVCQARIQGSQQLAAAIFNSWLSNGSVVPIDPVTGLSLIEAMHNALRDGNRNEIQRLLPLLDAYNNSGDDTALIDVHSVVIGRAEPKDARGEADLTFADCGAAPH